MEKVISWCGGQDFLEYSNSFCCCGIPQDEETGNIDSTIQDSKPGTASSEAPK